MAGQQRPVPAAKRSVDSPQSRPPLLREQPTGLGEQDAVGGRVLRPLPSSPEDRGAGDAGRSQAAAHHRHGRGSDNHAQEPVQHTSARRAVRSTPAAITSGARHGRIEFLYPTTPHHFAGNSWFGREVRKGHGRVGGRRLTSRGAFADWRWFPPAPRRTVREVFPHTAHRRLSPSAFGFARHGRLGRGAMTRPLRLINPMRFGDW